MHCGMILCLDWLPIGSALALVWAGWGLGLALCSCFRSESKRNQFMCIQECRVNNGDIEQERELGFLFS